MRLCSSLLIVSFSAARALAHDGHEPAPQVVESQVIDGVFDAGDWTLSVLAGNAGGALGAAVGGALGYGLAGNCQDDGDSDSLFGDCFLHGYGEAFIGGGLGSIVGGAGGIYAYGQGTGHRGSYWAAAGGWTLGLVGAIGLGVAASDSDAGSAIGWVALFTLPALGGTAGYALSLEEGPAAPSPVGGLLEFQDGVLRMGVTDIDVAFDEAGDVERVDLTVVGGRF
jgi:hypothetical protein